MTIIFRPSQKVAVKIKARGLESLPPPAGDIVLAKAIDRRIIGSINKQILMAKYCLDEELPMRVDLSHQLNQNILSYLKPHYKPAKAFLSLEEKQDSAAAVGPRHPLPTLPENREGMG